jgi:DNA-binding NarL/FixJ family response regulator
MDFDMPEMDGVTATRRLRRVVPAARIVILTTYETTRDVARAIRAGAAACVGKDAPRATLLAAIRG